jgi:vacuole morphology and inheritance protein 14
VNVRNGAELLDRLIKDVVTEGNPFDLEKFIPLLSDRVNVFNPECRKVRYPIIMIIFPPSEFF